MALNLGQLLAAPTGGRTGGVKAGTNISISADGTISVSPGGAVALPNLVVSANGPLPASGYYENITINSGVTATIQGLSSLRARTSVTINGSIIGDSAGYPGGRQSFDITGAGIVTYPLPGQGLGTGSLAYNTYHLAASPYSFSAIFSSSGSAGSLNSNNPNSANASTSVGGNAGGSLVIICEGSITLGATASISCQGGNAPAVGANGDCYSGAGGGGAGGLILLQAGTTLSLAAGSTLNVSGGNGGNGAVSGTSPGAPAGGGGGGGYIVLNSSNTTDSSTKTLTGGSPGVGINNQYTGAPGASFGGQGGNGSNGATNATAGSAGQTLLNNYI